MGSMLEYGDYLGSVQFSSEEKVFHGKIEFIRALVTYEGTDAVSLERAFRESVDDYLELCEREGMKPEKPFKGSFNVRTGSDLHRRSVLHARENNMNLTGVVVEALKKYLPA